MTVPTPTTKSTSGGFNPINMGKKILDVWESDRMLGIVTAPFGIAFGIWFFTRKDSDGRIILYLSIAVGLVALSSAVKHIFITWLQAKYGIKAREQEVIEVEADTIRDKEIAESSYQMEMTILLAQQSSFASDSLIKYSVEYMKSGKSDPEVLNILAKTITDIRIGMNKQLEGICLPFKEFVENLFTKPEDEKEVSIEDMPKPGDLEQADKGLTVEMIEKETDRIESSNPTSEDLKKASKDLGYDV